MYLVLEVVVPAKGWGSELPYLLSSPVQGEYAYRLADDGVFLLRGWHSCGYPVDSTISGVFADYLEENREELLTGATGPSDPAARLDALITYLRDRFRSQQ
jgi:hypothetical protein